ncbi:MAG: imidazole glycerol phosphate synthase subunit HisH [Alphaproteobacteria bacterium]
MSTEPSNTGFKPKVVIVDYQAGNLRSCSKAFEHIAGKDRVRVITKAEELADATHIVLPGQGAFGDCGDQLRKIDGMVEALQDAVRVQGKPFFGICVGMQLLADDGLEFGTHKGLGWIGGTVKPIEPEDASLKIPHMGWNNLDLSEGAQNHPVMAGVQNGDHAYFVHSYKYEAKNKADVISTVEYGGDVTAIVAKDTFIGAQFHPEKSQALGLRMIENFLGWTP